MIRRNLLLALPLALASCGGESQQSVSDSEDRRAPVAVQVGDARLVLDADGVGAKGAEPLSFGRAREDVDALATKAFGDPPSRSSNEECGAGPMDFSEYGPLQIAFQDDRFAGWFLRTGDGVVTSDGVRPGMTIDQLRKEHRVRELDTTLEGEFEYTTADYGTITGFADPDGTITGLAAGVTCFFR